MYKKSIKSILFFIIIYFISLPTMENIVTTLKIRCAKSKVSLTRVCIEAGVNRQLLTKWEKQEPKSFQILKQLEAVLDRIEKTNK